MFVIKRDGSQEEVSFDKILHRIKKVSDGLNVNVHEITQKVCTRIHDNVKTHELDEFASQLCSSLIIEHPDYGTLASRLVISNHQKRTSPSFSETISTLYDNYNFEGQHTPIISKELYEITMKNKEKLNDYIKYDRDYLVDYFGFKTLERAYLQRKNGKLIERPQHMWMRVALGIHGKDFKEALETYDLLSQKFFTHASPTLFNAGTPRSQMSSCFLLDVEDSIKGIYENIGDCAQISKYAGGIGINVHDIRCKDSVIRGTNGKTDGIIPMLRVYNATARYVNQSSKRLGSIAVYIEPWHGDIMDWLDLRKNHGAEEERARDLFYAMWIPDLFMERVKNDEMWSLMCPDICKGLSTSYGEEFKHLYTKYEREGKFIKQVKAQQIWFKILEAQIETGTPYMAFKDAVNIKSNQKNIGAIKSSNLCVAPETLILTDKGHIEIQKLEGLDVNVWNGHEFSKTKIIKTGENQELMKVSFSDSSELICTPYHKFYIQDNYISNTKNDIINSKNVNIVEAQNLKPDMKIIKCNYPIIDNQNEILEDAYTNGFFTGDGTYNNSVINEKNCNFKALEGKAYCKRHINYQIDNETTDKCSGISYSRKNIVTLYGEKIKLLEHLNYNSHGEIKDNKLNVTLNVNLKDKFFVPMNNSLKSKLEWFAGYADADGCITKNNNNNSLQIACIHKEFLLNVKLMLQTCGINSIVTLMKNKGYTYLPDGKNGYKNYSTKPIWRILVASNELRKLVNLGFKPNRLIIDIEHNIQRSATKFIKIKNIEKIDRIDDTYCFNETKRHAGIFNGNITSQCIEIVEFTAPDEIAVCNLASICLPMFVEYEDEKPIYNYEKLHHITKVITKNLNKIIDKNFYPVDKAWRSNMKHRPTGIGVQGLADTFIKMRVAFDSVEAKEINKKIFETIYHGSLECSMEISKKRKRLYDEMMMLSTAGLDDNMGKIKDIDNYLNLNEWEHKLSKKFKGSYSTYEGSPISKGILQFDMWNVKPDSGLFDWNKLKEDIKENGVRNSLLVALMPTASTSQIMGNNEAFEAITSNLYKRKTLAGEFILVNKHLVSDLIKLDLWNKDIREQIMINDGSVQNIDGIPDDIKALYKTVWEIKQKSIIDLAAERAPFVCQTQSMNLFVAEPNPNLLTKMHFYTWSKGLKTGMYYLRTRPRASTQQFTIDPTKSKSNLTQSKSKDDTNQTETNNTNINTMKEPEECENCGA